MSSNPPAHKRNPMVKNRLLAAMILFGTSAYAALPGDDAVLTQGVDEIRIAPKFFEKPHRDESIGAPPSMELEIILHDKLADFETPATLVAEDEDTEQWSDERFLEFYRDEIGATAFWIHRIASSPDAINQLGEEQIAAQRFKARPKMSGVSCMAVAIQGEAGGESAAGKAAVAETIMSRAGGNPARVCAVVFAYAQFEAMTKRLLRPSAETLRIAQAAIRRGKGCGFDHFLNKSLQRSLGRAIPSWVRNLERRGCRHKKIGQQDYYSSCHCAR